MPVWTIGSTRTPEAAPALILAVGLLGCSDHHYDLAYLPGGAAPDKADASIPASIAGVDTDDIAKVVNERPGGAASLGEGTSGGGLFEEAVQASALVQVQTAAELVESVSGDTSRIVLIHPGDYDLGEDQSYAVETCQLACADGDERSSETQPAGKCGDDSEVEVLQSRMRRLRVGSNKTILGLAGGATLRNVQLELSGSHNIILRNLEITEVNPGIVGAGEAILMWPSDHVWVDHCSFSDSSHTFINIHSSWDQESPTYALMDIASQITISFNSFSGSNEDNCGGQQHWIVGTQRDPALTVHHNVFVDGDRGTPYLFGSETWGHVYNNFVQNTETYGVGVTCGAVGLVEANVFERNESALHVGDDGASSWPFCSDGLYGTAWFPTDDADQMVNNLLDAASGLGVSDQPLDGENLELPQASGLRSVVTVPLFSGSERYEYSLDPVSTEWAQQLVALAGVGRLF